MDDDTLDRKLAREQARAALFDEREEPVAVGRYRLEGRIGSGGMGVVYRAHDPHLNRRVALKLTRPSSTNNERMARFMREAQALARLSHPNVVTVHDVGVHDGRLFIAMELVEGETLDAWVTRERPDWQRVVQVMAGAAHGLAAAHADGLVHRDFKPANVIVTPDGDAKVLDFGLVRPAEVLSEGDTKEMRERPLEVRITESQAVIGTPAFMAPEQLEAGVVDARTDQYSFCATIYSALWEQLPHPASSIGELAESVLEQPARPPPQDTTVPVHVREAVMRGLSRWPEQRFASMDELLGALVPRPTARERKFPIGIAAAGCVAFALFAAGAAGITWWMATQRSEPVAVAPTAPPTAQPVGGGPGGTLPTAPVPVAQDEPKPPLASAIDAGAPVAVANGSSNRRRDAGRRRRRVRRTDAGPPVVVATGTEVDEELDTGAFTRDVVRRCWRNYQEQNPDTGSVGIMYSVTVAPDGSVSALSVQANRGVNAPELIACIRDRGTDWEGFRGGSRALRANRAIILRRNR